MKFWELYRIIIRRKWMIAGLVLVTLIGVYAGTAGKKPYYVASVQIMPSDTALYRPILPSPSSSVASALGGRQADSQLPNLMSLLRSREVAERAVRTAGLRDDPESIRSKINVDTAPNPGASGHQDGGTDIIEVSVSDDQPERAVRIVNSVAHVFSNFYQEISHQEAVDNSGFLERQLIQSKNDLDSAAERLKEFKRRNRITSTGDLSEAAMSDLRQATANRDAARAALAETQAKLSDVQSQLRKVGPMRSVTEATSNTPMVQQLETQLAQLTVQLNDAKAKYEDVHPQVVAVKDSIDQVQRRLLEERGKLKTSVNIVRDPVYDALLQQRSQLAFERDGTAARLGQAAAAVARASGQLRPGLDINLLRLENDFQGAQTTYNNLSAQLSQARINEKETTSTGAIRIVDEAKKADGPIGVNKAAYLLLGAMLSLLVGAGLAITLESIDNRIKTNLDVEQLLGLPVTALIPRSIESGDSSLARVTYTDPLSPIAEAYRFLRTDLLLSTKPIGAKAIMVATAKPGQGGTSTVANLGISLAMDGKRVILVDADMRRPCLCRIFKVPNDFGLSSVLSNEKDLEEVMFSTEIDNLFIIPAGPTPSNPSELLGSGRMRMLVQRLTEIADYVLFDTPSAIAFTDAVVLSQVADGVMLVVRAQQVPRGAELQVRNLLNKANANILGVVLNDVQPEMVDSYYYHSHYYPDTSSKRQRLFESMAGSRYLPPTGGSDQ